MPEETTRLVDDVVTDLEMLSSLVGAEHAGRLLSLSERLPDGAREEWLARLLRYLTTRDSDVVRLMTYRHEPVSVREFLESKFYLGKKGEVYPVVMQEAEEINSGKYDEVVLVGGIGAAKTSLALYSQAYQLYLLSCYWNPHAVWALDRSSEIKIVFQSLNKTLAKGVDYQRFKSMVEASPYFQNHFAFDPGVASVMKFPSRVEVEPISGAETAAISQNVIGGVIDEINFMAVVENSRMSADGTTYDQAVQLYNAIARRRKSRFLKAGRALPGLLCLVSSKKVPGQFTDQKEEEARVNGRIYVYSKRVWEVKPEGTYSGEYFSVFVGDGSRQPRVLRVDERVRDEDRHLVDAIPVEYRHEFEQDITKALRDIAGRSTMAVHPYLPRRDAVLANFGRRESVFEQERIDFSVEKLRVRVELVKRHPESPRWAHVDLGVTSDSAGLAISHVSEFKKVDRGGYSEVLPVVEVDGVLEVVPPVSADGEIDFSAIRRVLYRLRDMGMPVKWVSFDSYQSTDSMQILRRQGFLTDYVSMDTTMIPYDLLKQALYDGRTPCPRHVKLATELVQLERDFRRGKVDHPAHGSKDLADSLAGCVYGLTMRRETWSAHGVPITQAVSVSSVIRDNEHESGQGRRTDAA
jgi:hypothetical protein